MSTGNKKRGPREIGPKDTHKEDFFDEEVDAPDLVEVKLKSNIKYNGRRYAIGSRIKIDEDDLEEFIKAGVIQED